MTTRALWLGLALALFVAGCGGAASPQRTAAQSAAVTIAATEFKFTPNAVTVSAGRVTFAVADKGSIAHTFAIPALNVNTGNIDPGQTKRVTVALKPGTYNFLCTLPGHAEAGMTGTLTVK